MDIKEKIKSFPDKPGVYLMTDASGKIIYVGKAISLRKRVRSYFVNSKNRDPKTNLLLANIRDISFIKASSEIQALILEAQLIKKNYPKYNVELRDDKSYPYIKISKEYFPTVTIARPRKKSDAIYYGPYTSALLLRGALKIIRRIFPYRTCKISRKQKACLDYHLGLCPGVCIGKISREEYQRNIENIQMVLENKQEKLLERLYQEMKLSSNEKRFEEAAKTRDQIAALSSLYSQGHGRGYLHEAQNLKEALRLPKIPSRIEAFDISNIMGKQAAGSMVSFLKGKPDKNNYRRFKIKTVSQADDYRMLCEIVLRRYSRLKNEGKRLPDLVVVDGGKGQLWAVKNQLDNLKANIPVISIAKGNEEIFLPDRNESVKLPLESSGLQLIQRVRDEAHRFALKYHRLLRKKALLKP